MGHAHAPEATVRAVKPNKQEETIDLVIPDTEYLAPHEIQVANEYTYSKKYIDGYIRQEVEENSELMAKIDQVVESLQDWSSETYYPSKERRLTVIYEMTEDELHELCMKIATGCAYAQEAELFACMGGRLAYLFEFEKHTDNVKTISEVLCFFIAHEIISIEMLQQKKGKKYNKQSIGLKSAMVFSPKLTNYIAQSSYLPPMLCEPNTVKHNWQTGLLTVQGSIVLNAHTDEFQCLDVINKQNKTPLALDLELLLNVEECPNKEPDSAELMRNWLQFKTESEEFYLLIYQQSQGNREQPGAIWMTYKVDMRGRLYSQGYHINPQGMVYKKAMIELYKQEVIDVPEQFRKTA